MKNQKLSVFLDISFKPNEDLEKRIRTTLKRPFRFDGSGQFLGKRPQRDLNYVARVPSERLLGLRRMAYTIRRWKGIAAVGFSVVEQIPLTKGSRTALEAPRK